jgi:lactoylglutathione lyase
MLRVNNLDEPFKFGCDQLGMKLLRQHNLPGAEFTLAFVVYDTENETAMIESTWNWRSSRHELGTDDADVATGVDDIYQTCADLKQRGVNVVREARGPTKHGTAPIVFIADPNGH